MLFKKMDSRAGLPLAAVLLGLLAGCATSNTSTADAGQSAGAAPDEERRMVTGSHTPRKDRNALPVRVLDNSGARDAIDGSPSSVGGNAGSR